MLVPAVRQFDAALGQRAGRPVHGPRRQRRLVRRRAVGRRRRRTGTGLRRRHARLDTEHTVRIAEPCRATATAAAREHKKTKRFAVNTVRPSGPKRGRTTSATRRPTRPPKPGGRHRIPSLFFFFLRAEFESSPLRVSNHRNPTVYRMRGVGGGWWLTYRWRPE